MNTLPLSSPPESLCLLRLSAIGDISHALPVVRTLQTHWPSTRLAWVIGAAEHTLVGDVPGVEFIIFDKARRLNGLADLRRQLAGRRFDVLLHMQMSLRASLASLAIPATIKLGFDRTRAKDLQWLFTTHRIAYRPAEHVLDSFFGFTAALGLPARDLRWEIPIPDYAREFAAANLPDDMPTLLISPCSSHAYRNWNAEGYAAVADHAVERHGMRVVLTGGLSAIETKYGRDIEALARHRPLNLIGRTNLKQLLALLERTTVLVAPDSGPAHLATAVGTPVIGLYAATDPARARPYRSGEWVVSRYGEAAHQRFGTPVEAPPFGRRVREPGTMDRITPRDVTDTLDRLMGRT